MNEKVNLGIGVTGTVIAAFTPEKAAIFAGVSTGLWMLWQLGVSVYDRLSGKNANRPKQ